MRKQKNSRLQPKVLAISIVIFVTFASIVAFQTAQAQINKPVTTAWNLNLTIRANNSTTINGNQQETFAPFDLIQLTANLASGNLTAPNIPIAFNVRGPITSSYPTEIVTSSMTDNTSSTKITFRIPMEENEKTVLGTWQIYANAKTSNGTLQQKETFQVAWPLQITSINFSNSKDQKQNMFAPGDFAKAILTLNSSFAQNGNIDLNVLDGTGNIINETQMQNISFNANSDNRVVYEFKIPADASPGTATLNVDTISGSYQEIKIMSAQNKTAYFMIGNNTASIPTPTATPTAPPPIENTMSLFSWVLVATGFFTFTTLFMFLKRKPMPKINVQKPQSPSPTLSQNMTTPPAPPSPQELTTPQSSTTEIALEKITNSALKTQLPSIYEKLEIPTLESISSQDQKQIIINQLAKISSTSQRLQGIESELIIEKEQLNKEITDLNKTLEEQEKVMKNYFDTIRKEIAKITPNLNGKQDIQEKKPTQQPDKKDDAN